MLARRDAALAAFADEAATSAHLARIESGANSRHEILLELEMLLGLESPREMQALRLALQVKKLRDRFQSAASASANNPGDRLLAWCSQPGVADTVDRQRRERVFAAMERAR